MAGAPLDAFMTDDDLPVSGNRPACGESADGGGSESSPLPPSKIAMASLEDSDSAVDNLANQFGANLETPVSGPADVSVQPAGDFARLDSARPAGVSVRPPGDPARESMRWLAIYATIEEQGGETRNRVIHLIDSTGCCVLEDILAIEVFTEAFCDVPVPAKITDDLATVWFIRMLDYCREHYYAVDEATKHALDAAARGLLPFFPDQLHDQKRKNQLRNYLRYELKQKWATALVNDAPTFDAAVRAVEAKSRKVAALIRTARDDNKFPGLENIGQALHQLKSEMLKVRTERSRTAIARDIRQLLAASNGRFLQLPDLFIAVRGELKVVRLRSDVPPSQLVAERLHHVSIERFCDCPEIGPLFEGMTAFLQQWAASP